MNKVQIDNSLSIFNFKKCKQCLKERLISLFSYGKICDVCNELIDYPGKESVWSYNPKKVKK